MATRRSEGSARSPLWTLGGLVLLAIPGFALGLLVGVAWEDPGLLLGHLFGRTELVAWSRGADDAVDDGSEERAPEASRAGAPERPPAVSAAPRPSVSSRPPVIQRPWPSRSESALGEGWVSGAAS